MIRMLNVLAVAVVAVLAALFVYLNPDSVHVKYYGGIDWQVNLPLLLIGAFCSGVAVGGLFGGLKILKLRRQIGQLRRQQKTD